MANYNKPVVFKLGNELYGVDINLVQAIENDANINVVPVPNSISYIKGIVNLRSEVIPIYSLKRKFNMPDEEPIGSYVIITAGSVKIGLEVDEVVEIGNMENKIVSPMPILVKNAQTMYLDRVVSINDKLIVLLDVNKLLTEEEVDSVMKITEELS